MTVEEHLRIIIGDLVLRVAQLSAEIDALKADLAAKQGAT
jgi:uncharacterized small protein (DUF1192 family)